MTASATLASVSVVEFETRAWANSRDARAG